MFVLLILLHFPSHALYEEAVRFLSLLKFSSPITIFHTNFHKFMEKRRVSNADEVFEFQ